MEDSAVARMSAVIESVFGGPHHVGKITKSQEGTEFESWEMNRYGDMSTFDFDHLTRLVIAAHEHCVRASIQPSGPGMLKIRLDPRAGRDGRMSERHPTLAVAMETDA